MPPEPLAPQATTRRLADAGIALPASAEAADAAQARAAAAKMGSRRFVLKAGGLLHKSDEGGVVLDLASAEAVEAAANDLLTRLGDRAAPLVVQEQRAGLELLIGVRRSERLGAVLVVGLGGIHTEIFGDVARSLVPVDRAEARGMLDRLRARPLLAGARGAAPRDAEAVVDLLVQVSDLAESYPDIVELDLNPVLVGPVGQGTVAVDARMLVEPPVPPSPFRPDRRELRRMLRPDHIAVVGVSDDPHKVGAKAFRYLIRHGFAGRLDAIHPAGGIVQGHTRYRSLKELDAVPDLVCVAVPARHVAGVAREAVELGVGGFLVHSSDFAEIGETGQELQQQLQTILREGGIPFAGPNAMGIVAPGANMAASISGGLESEHLEAGSTALVSSSGALGSCLATRLMGLEVGLSHWIHVGNEADLRVSDYLDWLADDAATRSVGLLLEDIKDGPAFVAAARRVIAAGKPVFAYHMVRSEKGEAAARSHTGAMVGSFEIREAVLRAGGVVTVPTLQVLEDALRLAASDDLPSGPRVVALTFSGGACTIIADEAEQLGLELPDLSLATQEAVRGFVPSFAAVRNPLDVSFQMVNDPESFQGAMAAMLEGGAFDAALVQFTTNADPGAAATARAVLSVRAQVSQPVYVSRYGGPQLAPVGLAVYEKASVPVLDAPDRSMRVIAALVEAGIVVRKAANTSSTPEEK